jgi:hypothetical protein
LKADLETDLDADRRRIFPSFPYRDQQSELHPRQQKPSKKKQNHHRQRNAYK